MSAERCVRSAIKNIFRKNWRKNQLSRKLIAAFIAEHPEVFRKICPYCKAQFTSKKALSRHLKHTHGPELEEDLFELYSKTASRAGR